MLTIENHNLILDDVQHPLPQLDKPATVEVWRVPTEYRPSGIFISVAPIGEPQEVPACNLADCEYLGSARLDSHPQALLAAAKAEKNARIKADRDAQCEQPVQALGRTWDADKRSQELLAYAITIAQAGGPLPPVWRDYDNDNMPVTSIADLLAIAGAIAAQTQTAYAQSWARKAAVDAAQTLDEVEAA
jgi:hypothetical protein